MKLARQTFHFTRLFTAGLALAIAFGAGASAADVNLAVVAQPSSSRVSGDTTLAALNDGHAPESSHVRGRGSYGNWPARGTQWVQYEWHQPISTKKVDVYWWDDRRGVRLPRACRLMYWDGERFAPVHNPSGLGVVASQYNATTFDDVSTSKLRLEMDGDGDYSTGLLEWRVYDSGNSPDFPPSVMAGTDRVVVLGGKTYLAGTLKTLAKNEATPTNVAWEKSSGPGEVVFADATALTTTAQFSALGDYVLRLAATKGALSASSTLAVKVVPPPPERQLTLIDTKNYRIDSPLWSRRAKALIVNWIPHCIRKISDPELPQGGINNFIDAANKLAGKPHNKHRGYVFSNAWVYNTIESICVALMVDAQGDREILRAQQAMQATLDEWIPKVLAAQESDGYIQTFFTLGGFPRWSPRHRADHEGYVAGYFLEMSIAHYLLTDQTDPRLYDAAKKLADCWCDNVGPSPKKPWYDGHQAMEIALVRFGRFVNDIEGGDEGHKYIELAKFLLDKRQSGHEYDQSHVPVVQQYEAVGHAVRASYSYAGMADVAMETGNVDYQSAVMSLWDNLVNRKYYVTGGVGSGETSEGFGPDYSLRHNAYCESCSSCGEIFLQHKLHLTYHDAKYVDLYEETLYNALLGSVDLNGKNFYYQNPLDSSRPRYDWHGCPCCVGNIPRTLLMLPTWAYSKSADSIWVNLFIGSTVTVEEVAGTDIELVQATDYPWGGNVSITVNPAESKSFSIRLRVPDRSVSELYSSTPPSDGIISIAVNGSAISPRLENGYAVVSRTWEAGDKVDLVLPMKLQRINGVDKIAATRGQVALRYGPLVYCVESVDQDLGKTLNRESVLRTEWRNDLLGGVKTITGTWADGSPLTAIPYYARNNRSADTSDKRPAARSSVWMKETVSDLPRSTPEAQGVSSKGVLDFVNAADHHDAVHSFMLLRHGHVVAEGWWAPFTADDPHQLYSLSKSFTSTAVGLAIADGKLRLDDPVLSFFPDDAPSDASAHLKSTRVRDLLCMSSGHDASDLGKFSFQSDKKLTREFLALPVKHQPGTHFLYNTPATYICSAIVQKVTGERIVDYLQPRLFTPLGIKPPFWSESPQGISHGGFGLSLCTEDIARFGQLYLQQGQWNGRQLVPAAWVQAATSRQTANGTDPESDWNQGYGYQFWRCRHNAYRGDGTFGQFCIVMPEFDAVLAITSGTGNMGAVMQSAWDHLLPAMKQGKLPPDNAAVNELGKRISTLQLPVAVGRETSPLSEEVSGKEYRFADAESPFQSMRLELKGDATVLTITDGQGQHRFRCGHGCWIRHRVSSMGGLATRVPNPEDVAVAGSGAWSSEDTYSVRLHLFETPYRLDLSLRFHDDSVTVGGTYNVGFGAKRLPMVVGKR